MKWRHEIGEGYATPIVVGDRVFTLSRADGNEVVVIYNSAMPESKSVAEHYAERRQVPKSQVFGFELSKGEDISRAEYRDTLEKLLLKKLEAAGLWRLGDGEAADTNGKPVKVEGKVLESQQLADKILREAHTEKNTAKIGGARYACTPWR